MSDEPSYPPPVDFRILIGGYIGQAMVALGKMPHPVTGDTSVDLTWARYWIDVVGMIADKTHGNLEAAEDAELQSSLSMLRLTYVDTKKAQDAATLDSDETDTETDTKST